MHASAGLLASAQSLAKEVAGLKHPPPRQACFCGLLRLASTALRRARSATLTVTMIPLRVPETRPPASPWEFSRLALRALFGWLQESDLHALHAKEAVVQTRKHRPNVATDGEVNYVEAPLQYRIRPRAPRVIVPAEDRLERNAYSARRAGPTTVIDFAVIAGEIRFLLRPV